MYAERGDLQGAERFFRGRRRARPR
jgi:hypothetical protein